MTRGSITLALHTAGYVSADFTIDSASGGVHGYKDSPRNACAPESMVFNQQNCFGAKWAKKRRKLV